MAFVPALFLSLSLSAVAQEEFDPFDPTDDDEQTGLAIGTRIPDFQAIDQNGDSRDFDSIKGPNGAMLLFYRSADW